MAQVSVLHVLPRDMWRGAQTHARMLRETLDSPEVQHRTLTLFRSEPAALRPDIELNAPGERKLPSPLLALHLRRAALALRTTILVAHGSDPLRYCALAAMHDMTLVYHRIGTYKRGLIRPQIWLQRALVARVDSLVSVSRDCITDLKDVADIEPRRAVVIPNGRDPAVYFPAPSSERDPRVIFVGQFVESKRPSLFIELVETLRREGLAFTAEMVGDGPILETLRPRAVAAQIDVLGRRSDVPERLRLADILVFPSLADNEGMPGVLIEAAMSGLPIVATGVPGVRDVVNEGETGLIVDEMDAHALIAKTRALIVDRALRRQMGTAARTLTAERYSLKASADGWAKHLASLAALRR